MSRILFKTLLLAAALVSLVAQQLWKKLSWPANVFFHHAAPIPGVPYSLLTPHPNTPYCSPHHATPPVHFPKLTSDSPTCFLSTDHRCGILSPCVGMGYSSSTWLGALEAPWATKPWENAPCRVLCCDSDTRWHCSALSVLQHLPPASFWWQILSQAHGCLVFLCTAPPFFLTDFKNRCF